MPSGELAIEAIRPNPAAGAFAVSLVLTPGMRARLELLDVAGRRVQVREFRPTAARQTMLLGEDGALPAGIYLVRLSQGGRVVSSPVAMLH